MISHSAAIFTFQPSLEEFSKIPAQKSEETLFIKFVIFQPSLEEFSKILAISTLLEGVTNGNIFNPLLRNSLRFR